MNATVPVRRATVIVVECAPAQIAPAEALQRVEGSIGAVRRPVPRPAAA